MIREALDVFEYMLKNCGERLVTDAYIPKDGTYLMFNIEEDFKLVDKIEIKKNKTGNIEGSEEKNYEYFKILDYYSKLIDIYKPMADKKIHSNNYLSFFVKKDTLKNNELKNDTIKKYYEILKYPKNKYKSKKNSLSLYEAYEKKFGKPNIELIERIEDYVLKLDLFKNIDLNNKDYIKAFFTLSNNEETISLYKKESERYLTPNIFNNNDYNIVNNENIIGLSNNNMGMNSKKPYLENKTRKVPQPYLIDTNQALLQMKLFDYLMGLVDKKKYNIYICLDDREIRGYTDTESPRGNLNGIYLRCKKEANEVEIQRSNVISNYNPNLKVPFRLKNYNEISDKGLEATKIEYNKALNSLWEVKGLIDFVMFSNMLKNNLYTEAKDISIKDTLLKRSILDIRNSAIEMFYCCEEKNFIRIFDKISLRLIKDSILNGHGSQAQNRLNLRWSFLNYYKGDKEGESVVGIREELRQHINSSRGEEWDFTSDYEYSYGVGQAVAYILSLTNGRYKSPSFVNPFLDAKKPEVIKKKLLTIYKKYNYKIQNIGGLSRGEQLISHIMSYEPNEILSEYIMAGFTGQSLIYEKKTSEEE